MLRDAFGEVGHGGGKQETLSVGRRGGRWKIPRAVRRMWHFSRESSHKTVREHLVSLARLQTSAGEISYKCGSVSRAGVMNES